MKFLIISILLFISIIIIIQDFKQRLISLWVLIVYGICLSLSVILFNDFRIWIFNLIGVISYGLLILGCLKAYLYFKFKEHKKIIDDFIGLADVLVFVFIGLTFNVTGLIIFFSFAFSFSLICFYIYSLVGKNVNTNSIPLAGLLIISHIISIIILNLVDYSYFVVSSLVLK